MMRLPAHWHASLLIAHRSRLTAWAAQEDYADGARLLKQGDMPQARRREAWDLMLACWLNEAQCWLKLEQWRRVVEICSDVLKHDAKSVKVRGVGVHVCCPPLCALTEVTT